MLYAYRYRQKSRLRLVWRGLSFILLFVGLVLLATVVYPLASFQLTWGLNSQGLLTPTSQTATSLVSPVVATSGDDTNVRNWFPQDRKFSTSLFPDEPIYYSLTIPKLKIANAVVEQGGTDLKKNLVAWPTSVLPGQMGAAFIFGHSALPSFYNPTNYSTIFTHLYDLTEGAEILVNYDGVRYKYVVETKRIVDPNDFSILEQRFDRSRLILITCVPPGTLDKRGIVTAKLVKI